MKIKRLEFKAFGPFSDHTLDFSSEIPGLHVVYGPNESGKSSSLRALQALLFGFPVRTSDNFLHSYDQLLIGGCLQGMDGQELMFLRRKKRMNDLFDPHDNPLDSAVLLPYLHGIELDLFTTLYGIDHESLVKGGQGILDQQGEIGQALFSAGAGLASMKAVLDTFEEEGDSLFKPRGSSKAINEALTRYKELQTQMKQATLSGREWQDHQHALEAAEKKKAEAIDLSIKLNREKYRLERLKQALPYLGQRRKLMEDLTALGAVIELPSDFAERRKKIEQQGRDARSRFETATARLSDLREKKAGISLNQGLLDHADAIEELHQRLGQFRKAVSDRLRLEGQHSSSRAECANLLKQIRPGLAMDEIERLRPGLSKKKTIQTLSANYAALIQWVNKSGRLLQSIQKEIEAARNNLHPLPRVSDAGKLSQTLMLVQKAGDLDGEIKTKQSAWNASQSVCNELLNRLGLWKGSLELAAQLAIPLPETLKRFEDEFYAAIEEKRRIGEEKALLESDLTQLSMQMKEIEYAADVPTEEELVANRSRRDVGWKLLRRQWLMGENVVEESRAYDPHLPLPDAYEKQVGFSDQIADRLYREADRVQKHAALKVRIEGNKHRLSELIRKDEHNEAALTDTTRRWNELWSPCGIAPLSPREMTAWVGGFDKLRFQVAESGKIFHEIESLTARRKGLRTLLLAALSASGDQQPFLGEELSPVLLHAEALVKSIQDAHIRYEKLAGKISDLQMALENAKTDHQNAEEELKQWKSLWTDALMPLGLDDRTMPVEASDFIETLQECFDRLKAANEFQKRIAGIDRDAREFNETVAGLATQIAPDLSALDAFRIVSQLKSRLNQAIAEQAILKKYEEEISSLEKAVIASRTDLGIFRDQNAELCKLAGCVAEEDMDEAERRSSESLKLKNRLEELEKTLFQIAEGVEIRIIEEQADGIDVDALPGAIETLTDELENKLKPEINQLSEIIGQEKNELKRMDGSDKAAELSDAMQQTLAKIRRLTERYIRVKLAARILREEIERYRAENQDPVLKIASRYFQKLTLSSFVGLRADIDDQGKPVLKGVRPDGAWLGVAGMSSGTRDQLYLALRLATLEWRIQTSEPMPFIVDDILINFDDDRSKATLESLADLAEKNQVILFTHHKQVFEAAQALLPAGRVFTHEIRREMA